MQRMLLLSGAVGAGKTAVAAMLSEKAGFQRLSTSGYIRQYSSRLGPEGQHLQLQELGDQLDLKTDYQWVLNDVALPAFIAAPEECNWLLDAARKPKQVAHFRQHLGHVIRHVHLTAPEEVLRERYSGRLTDDDPYDQVAAHPNEVAARSLEGLADAVFDTSKFETSVVVAHTLNLWKV